MIAPTAAEVPTRLGQNGKALFLNTKMEAGPIPGASMDLPFTVEQFFDIFEAYNTAIWPAQIVAYFIGIGAVALAFRENRLYGRIISGILALFWIWMGVFYHIVYFSTINPAAMIFGVLFVLEGLLFVVVGPIWDRLSFRFDLKPVPIVGAIFILYAMVVFPCWDWRRATGIRERPCSEWLPARPRYSPLACCSGPINPFQSTSS
jgi:hypothetical protein